MPPAEARGVPLITCGGVEPANFSDVNPPVHAWATLWLYKYESQLGRADMRFLERSFQGLMLNFSWWVNRKDP